MLRRPRLSTILLIINLGILLLPLGGIGALRLYESELVRRTESELISQGTIIGAVYREEILRLLSSTNVIDMPGITSRQYGLPATVRPPANADLSPKYHPITPKLDIAGESVLPPAPVALVAKISADPLASRAGSLITPILHSSKDATLVGIRVLDANGTVVASTGGELGFSLINREEAKRALTGEYVSLLRERISDESQPSIASLSRGNLMRVFVGMPVIHEGRVFGAVVLSRTPLDIRKALFQVRWQIAVGVSVLLGVVLLITILTSITVNRPLKTLVRRAEQIVRGEIAEAPIPDEAGIHEIVQLSHAMSVMAKTLEERADYIRAFANNVSHEFKTPLTSIRGAVELLDDHFQDMTTDDRNRFVKIITSETERMERLVRRLLDLARADTFEPGKELSDVCEILDAMALLYREKGVAVTVACSEDAGSVRMARETFESVISNLIENARQHGGERVRVNISGRIARVGNGRELELSIHDDGPGISAGNRDKVFRPFFTTARESGGSGLGLSIVQSLLHSHGGSISLEPGESGTLFRVMLPLC